MPPFRWPWEKPPIDAAPVPGMCGLRGGSYRVHWEWPGTEAAFLPIRAHVTDETPDDGPTLEIGRDYEGPLCPHELHVLAGGDSSRSLSAQWRITVVEL